jgi:hypothetical protein
MFAALFMKTTSLEATHHVIKRSNWDEPVFEIMKGYVSSILIFNVNVLPILSCKSARNMRNMY